MKKYFLYAAIIAIAAIIINYSLGGFKAVEPGLVTTEAVVIYGKAYEGSYKSDALDELIDELRSHLDKAHQQGQLTIVNYHQEELEKRGTVKQFVGIIWDQLPTGLNYDSILLDPYNGAQFRIEVKPLVMPSPEKLKGRAEDLAAEMKTSLAGYSVEQYQDGILVINFPFKEAD